ncbi:MAG: acylphosphatase [candidate division Zixibacteria bacterium]|nr:acylphosphatase [candidate division Zixibacteria bacterium]
MAQLIHVKAIIKGVVQGVGYRWFATRASSNYNVTGYISNLPNGDVETVVEGEKGLVMDFIKELRIGPSHASVSSIDISESEYTGKYKDFGVEFK